MSTAGAHATAHLASQVVAASQNENLSFFGGDPWWLIIIKVLAIFVFMFMIFALMMINFERKVIGYMQQRPGPNRAGPWGLLQSLADGVKLALKEDIIPTTADKIVFFFAPAVPAITALTALSVMPFGPADNEVSIFGHRTALQLTDLPVGVLMVLALSSIGIYGIVLGGWASGSTYPLLGGLRSSAQMISYEVAMGLSLAAVFIYSGTLSTSGVVTAQHGLWNAIPLLPSFLIFLVAMVGENNRLPFDLPEAEGELVGGYHTEYSSMRFALFFIGEYVSMAVGSSLAITLFLGGWRAPWPLSLWHGANHGWWPLLWFTGKFVIFMFVYIWLRAALPRLRYDQYMKFGWKVMLPLNLAWITVAAVLRELHIHDRLNGWVFPAVSVIAGLLVLYIAADSFAFEPRRQREEQRKKDAEERAQRTFEPMAGGFPVPPLPGQQLPAYTSRRALALAAAGGESAGTETNGQSGNEEGSDA